ncbi:hypothetical protein E9993_23555, partial [Labilibacter sediminis]
MAQEDSYTQAYSLSNSIGSTTRVPILYPAEYELWALHMEDYVLGIETHGFTIWEAMTVGPFRHAATRRVIKTLAEYNALLIDHANTPQDE